jgi:hypothetical protein
MMSSDAASCVCGSAQVPNAEEPLVCTLAGRDQADRASEFGEVFLQLERTETFDGGFRWHFRAQPGLVARLRDLARREHDCCRFFDFRITEEGGSIVWETRSEERAADVRDELMRLPDTLQRTRDVESMKRALSDAGLTFASDREKSGT